MTACPSGVEVYACCFIWYRTPKDDLSAQSGAQTDKRGKKDKARPGDSKKGAKPGSDDAAANLEASGRHVVIKKAPPPGGVTLSSFMGLCSSRIRHVSTFHGRFCQCGLFNQVSAVDRTPGSGESSARVIEAGPPCLVRRRRFGTPFCVGERK
eukprot:5342218-Amphidinium_carterae.1